MKGRLGLAIVPLVDILLVLLAMLMLLVAVPQAKEVTVQGSLPEVRQGAEPPPGVEVGLNAEGKLTGVAAQWALPKPNQEAVLYCQEAGIWQAPVVRLRAEARTPHEAVMGVVSFLQSCQVGEVAVIGKAAALSAVE